MTLKYASSDETSLELSLDGSQTTILQLPATSDVVIEKDFLIEGLTASEDIRKLRIKHLESSGIKLWDITFENVQNQTELARKYYKSRINFGATTRAFKRYT